MDNGGPAFPVKNGSIYHGMALRDWLAGQYLAGAVIPNAEAKESDLAAECYRVADAMLTERDRRKEKKTKASPESTPINPERKPIRLIREGHVPPKKRRSL